MAAETHLRTTRGQLPLEMESASPQDISEWFANKVNFSVKLPNYQESSGQEKLYTLEGARLVGYQNDYAAYVAYRMKERPISLVITSDSVAKPSGGEEIASRGFDVSLQRDRRIESDHLVRSRTDLRARLRPRRARTAVVHRLPPGHEGPGLHRPLKPR